ncbi:hypothetical protein WKW79_22855 [Variovorax robiniae]|uniref:DUF4229 domain-containing protein n=1 Tax=Variovorax robiniae TaxID=1836199 RepID=A0ABU8XCH7_9BURK
MTKASTWRRFWLPNAQLEPVPDAASAEEAEAVAKRNNLWLKTWMDMYILRWGGLWAASLVLVILAMDAPGIVFLLALVINLGALAGLIAMILIYRRASQAVEDRVRKDGR